MRQSDSRSRPSESVSQPAPSDQSARSPAREQLAHQLGGLPYREQLTQLRPERPLSIPVGGLGGENAVQAKADPVQMAGGSGGGTYPTGQDPVARTDDELWEECSDKVTLKDDEGKDETPEQKVERMKLAEAELKSRFNPDMVTAILSHDRGQTPRSLVSLAAEDGLSLGGHAVDMHVFGSGRIRDKKTLSMRVLRHVPYGCPGKAGAFPTLADGNTSVSGVLAAEMSGEKWKVVRAKLIEGETLPLTGALGGGSVALTGSKVQAVRLPPYAHPMGRSGRPLFPGDPELSTLPENITPEPDNPLTADFSCTETYVRVVPHPDAPGGWYVNSAWPQ